MVHPFSTPLRLACCLFLLIFLSPIQVLQAQGLMVNEISSGQFNNFEYIELIAVRTCPADSMEYLDIRDWRVDDNNGDFSCGPSSNSGVASGHIRFNLSDDWDSIPFGSIILLYNNENKNAEIFAADDPTDANGDGVYIIPANYLNIEYCAGVPKASGLCGSLGPLASDSYSCPFPFFNGNPWTTRIRLSDVGDCAQVRRPDGSYFHGISYGLPPIHGGPDSLQVGFDVGDRKMYYFNDGDYRDVTNFDTIGGLGTNPTPQTPGEPNNALNQNFIALQSSNCILPILMADFRAEVEGNQVELDWSTVLEINSDEYIVERAPNGSYKFEPIGRIQAAGNTEDLRSYRYIDFDPSPGTSFYRLRMVDQDGSFNFSEVRSVQYVGNHVVVNQLYPNPVTDLAYFDVYSESDYTIGIYDMTGRTVHQEKFQPLGVHETTSYDLSHLDPGLYIYLIYNSQGGSVKGRLVKK